jgi:hypothetical protein
VSGAFAVRTVFAGQRVEMASYDMIPSNEEGKAVCNLFLDFLSESPPEFRRKIPFLKKGNTELQWIAADGGVAFAAFYEDNEPVSMGILLSGLAEEADRQMIAELSRAVFGTGEDESLEVAERPVLINVIFPGSPELVPRTQLLSTALASVFFRVVTGMRGRES